MTGAAGAATGPPTLHTAEEAALLLKVKKSWLERQAAARKIPFTMLGRSYRFSDRHLAEIVRINEVTPAPATRNLAPPQRPRRNPAQPTASVAITPLRPRPRSGPRRVA